LKYYILNKPYEVLSQFSDKENRETLADYTSFPKDVYPIGRLDADSEGLLLLSNDKMLQHLLLEPKYRHPRTYLVQIEGIPTNEALDKLRSGVIIEKMKTLPAEVKLLDKDPDLLARTKPIRFRKNISTAWIEMTLCEGRNRQVRKMTAAVGHPTLRLVRIKIGSLTLEGLKSGESRELTLKEIESLRELVGIKKPDALQRHIRFK